jgi:hypothetical protein
VYRELVLADLRDVLNADLPHPPPPGSLRAKLLQSAQPPAVDPPPPVSLPAGFRQLLQLEELVDVSQNASHRAEHGSTSNAAFANPAMYRGRLLKMCISDGFNLDLRKDPNAEGRRR